MNYSSIDLAPLLQRLQALEARIDSLFLNKAMNQESGTLQLDEFDTHRFVHVPNWQLHEYMKQTTTWQRGPILTSDLYFLINPSEHVQEQVELANGGPINWNTHILVFRYRGSKQHFRAALETNEIPDVYLYWYQGSPYYGRFKLLPTMREQLVAKEFEIEEFPQPNKAFPVKFHHQLQQFVHSKAYTATITVDFESEYTSVPHVHWFTTPLNFTNMKISLQHVSTKQAIFEFQYGKQQVPTNTILHWMVSGNV